MKALFVNGSPRKNWNTFKLLESAMKGASESGAETELIHLYDYKYKGCVSCFACKLKNKNFDGICVYRDELRPVLEKAFDSDIIVMGSPIYFSFVTGMMRSFMERLIFPVMTYSTDSNGQLIKNVDKKIYTANIYTMNASESIAAKIGYPALLETNDAAFKRVLGYCESLCVYETLQFNDYSRYECNMFNGDQRVERNKTIFPEDLNKAYELGKRLVEKAKEGK